MNVRLQKSVSWKHLETCFKWSRIQDYMHACGVADDDPLFTEVKELMKENRLTKVEYDAHARRVLRLDKDAPWEFEVSKMDG